MQLMSRGFRYVCFAHGGYEAVHTLSNSGKVELIDHDSYKCDICSKKSKLTRSTSDASGSIFSSTSLKLSYISTLMKGTSAVIVPTVTNFVKETQEAAKEAYEYYNQNQKGNASIINTIRTTIEFKEKKVTPIKASVFSIDDEDIEESKGLKQDTPATPPVPKATNLVIGSPTVLKAVEPLEVDSTAKSPPTTRAVVEPIKPTRALSLKSLFGFISSKPADTLGSQTQYIFSENKEEKESITDTQRASYIIETIAERINIDTLKKEHKKVFMVDKVSKTGALQSKCVIFSNDSIIFYSCLSSNEAKLYHKYFITDLLQISPSPTNTKVLLFKFKGDEKEITKKIFLK